MQELEQPFSNCCPQTSFTTLAGGVLEVHILSPLMTGVHGDRRGDLYFNNVPHRGFRCSLKSETHKDTKNVC